MLAMLIKSLLFVLGLLGAVACGSTTSNISSDLKGAGCEAGCDEAKDKCGQDCAGGEDSTACELACDEARSKCASDCKE